MTHCSNVLILLEASDVSMRKSFEALRNGQVFQSSPKLSHHRSPFESGRSYKFPVEVASTNFGLAHP